MNIILLVFLAFTILFMLQNVVESKDGLNGIMNKVGNINITKHFDSIKKSINNSDKLVQAQPVPKVEYDNFPDPMTSSISQPLSPGYSPLNTNSDNLLSNDPSLKIIRDNGFDYYKNEQIYFDPSNIKKDTMDADPGNFSYHGLVKSFGTEDTLIKADSDEYLTKYPDYAPSDFGNQLTNTGFLYNNSENNKYINLKEKVLPENCKLNGNELECTFNNKLQKIPDKLMENNSDVLNSVGVIIHDDELIKSNSGFTYDEIGGNVYKSWKYDNEKELNGNFVFNNIVPSNPMGTNESYMSIDDKLDCASCSI
jgi:hypothetical protein